jgi:hypothetical protein
MSLSDQLQADLVDAMRNKEKVRLGTLRMVKTALENKQVEKTGELSDEETLSVLGTLVKQRRDSVEQFTQGGREEMARKEQEEISVIEAYLPAGATDDEIRTAVAQAIEETGASSMKDMGRVMKTSLAALEGKTVDGAIVSRIVKETLA